MTQYPELIFIFGDGDNIYQVVMLNEEGAEAVEKARYAVARAIHDKEGNLVPNPLSEAEIEGLRKELREAIDYHKIDYAFDWVPYEWVFENGELPRLSEDFVRNPIL